MRNVFIVGSKGIPANYGGFETFVEKLTELKVSNNIHYHVACISDTDNREFKHNNASCFNVKVPKIGPARAVLYDLMALNRVLSYLKEKSMKNSIVYILACRIGPFMWYYKRQFEKLGVKVYVNPDGHEWKRAKWNKAIRQYWKISERLMTKHADLLVCDSKSIEAYIREDYKQYSPKTTFIAYGATVHEDENLNEEKYHTWLDQWDTKANNYFLIVGRFVPENNYELMITEFMNSDVDKDLIIVTNYKDNSYFDALREVTGFEMDMRIKFVGTIYDQELLLQVRKNAYGYLHGHEVGGTNPSLLEALATTKLNLLLDVNFNKEVGLDSALYFKKEENHLTELLAASVELDEEEIEEKQNLAVERIENEYSWSLIIKRYEKLFTSNTN